MVKREDCVKIGEIGKTHNLQGALIVYTDNDLLEQYMDEPVFILLEGAPVPFYIAEDGLTERNHSSYIVKFDFVDSKEQADRLVGCDLLMDKYLLEEENELPFELSDLIGYSVLDELTGEMGVVEQVDNYSGNVVLTIKIFSKEILLPVSDEYVLDISHDEKRMHVNISEEIKELTEDLKRVKNEQSECFQKNATLMLAASIFAKMQQDTYAESAEYHITEPVKEYLVRLMEQPVCT